MAATILSLFSGYGGLDIGLEAALGGGRTVGYVEREAYAAAILLARMEEQTLEPAPVWCGNIEDADLSCFRGVDWVTGGFPCQPFSTAGKREGQADERWLWDNIVRVLREVQPRWCLFENVPGLVRLGLGPVLRDLALLGFDVEWDLFKASDVGASHRRERIFILAHRGHEPGRSKQQDSPESGGRDAQLADTAQQRRQGDGEAGLRTVRAEHDGRGTQLADTEIIGPRQGGTEPASQRRLACPAGDDHELADTGRELLEGGEQPGTAPEWTDRTGWCAGQPMFAPGPADLDVWARMLTEAPQVEPSLCRVADGSAGWLEYRQDRLRAIGNGVVPLQAAVAVRVLADRAGWELI